MIKKWNITIPELTGDEERRLYVYLPKSYYTKRRKRYPVMYMFDGHNLFFDSDASFGTSWGLKKYMDVSGKDLIIVGIECNHSPDFGRIIEYSPFNFVEPDTGTPIYGMGKTTMKWIIHELKPYIDSRFRTIPDRAHTYIGGSSMGGLMSLYAVLRYNRVFSRAAALSPSVWVAPEEVFALIDKAHLKSDTVIYMDYGSEEFANHDKMEPLFHETIFHLLNRHIHLTSRVVPHGEHTESCWEKQLPFVMNTILY